MTAHAAALDHLQRLTRAAPVAWRQDRVFRIAVIGAGVSGALLLVRIAAPGIPALPSPPAYSGSGGVPYLSVPGQTPAPAAPPADAPKIAPGHALSDVILVPSPDGDRFGTAPPVRRP